MTHPMPTAARLPAPQEPLVTVVIPTRGRPALLRRPWPASPARTTPGPWRSSSSTTVRRRTRAWPPLLRPVAVSCPVVNTRTGGLCGARNTGVLVSRGDFVASCDDDDLWYPAKVRLQVDRLLADPSLLAVGRGHPPAHGRPWQRRVARPRRRHHPRPAAGEPGQGAAQLDADDAPLRLRRGRSVRRGAAARVRRGLRLVAAREPGGPGRCGPGDPGRHPQGRPLLVPGPLAEHRRRAGVPARQASGLRGPAARSRTHPGPDRLRTRRRRRTARAARASRDVRCAATPPPPTHGSRSPWPDRGSSPVGCWRLSRRLGRGLS